MFNIDRFSAWLRVFVFNLLCFTIAITMLGCQKTPDDAAVTADEKTAVQPINSKKEFDAIMASSHRKLVVIDFYADWCSPCRELSPLLEKLAHEMEQSALFYKVNIDEHRTLSMNNGVTGIPYVAFFKEGKKVHSLLGIWPKESYIRSVERFALPVSSEPTKETPDGTLIKGIRVIDRTPALKLDDIFVFRGETVQLTFKALPSTYAVSIPQFNIATEGKEGEDLRVTFKASKVGVFPIFCNGDCPEGDGMAYGRIVVMPFTGDRQIQYEELTAKAAKALLDEPLPLILDVRTPNEYFSGHLPNARLIPVQQLGQRIKEIEKYKNEKVLIYCRSGNRSTVASEILIQNGFQKIFHLKDGINDWTNQGYPLSK